MALEINALLAFANSLRSLAQQIDKLAAQGSQTTAGSQNSASFSAALNSACDELAATQPSQTPAPQTAAASSTKAPAEQYLTSSAALACCPCCDPNKGSQSPDKSSDNSTQLPSWLAEGQRTYEADKTYWSTVEATNRTAWQKNPEALRKLQETYSPDTSVRQKAAAWLEKNIGPNWQASAPHVMETGNLLKSPLPDYLQEHYARYLQMSRTANANSQQTQALWENNPEALRKLQESYHPNTNVRREAIEWLEKNISPNWRACAPHVMETGRMLAALGEKSSSLAA